MGRWRIAVLVSAAIAISHLDRQTLPVAVNAIAKDIPLTNQQFSTLQSAFLFSYALMYAGGGKLTDALGTRRGFTVIMMFWSLACASHALALSFAMLVLSRFLLGMGEGGGWARTVAMTALDLNGQPIAAQQIEPFVRPEIGKLRSLQELIDQPRSLVAGRVGQKGLHLVGRR